MRNPKKSAVQMSFQRVWHMETSTIGGEDPRLLFLRKIPACSSCGYSEFTSFPPSLFPKAEGTP